MESLLLSVLIELKDMSDMLLTDTITSEISSRSTNRVSLETIAGPNILSKDQFIINCMHVIKLTTEDGREVTLLRLLLKLELAITLLYNIEVKNEA